MLRRHFLQQAAALAALPVLPGRFASASPTVVGRSRGMTSAQALRINGERLNGWLGRFDAIGRTATGINRVAYSDADLAGRAFALDLIRDSGFTPRLDAAGNIFALLPGSAAGLKPLLIGSHIDSVTDGGNYDGPVGSFAALEVARSLRDSGTRLRHPLEVVIWQNEEGGTIGSKIAVGLFTEPELDKVARSGKTVREGVGRIGGDLTKLASAVRKPGDVAGYIELHIEQGGRLEQAERQIGVVEGIVGLRWFEVTITGFSNHAGATPMDQRQDAMLAAAKFTVAVNEAIRSEAGRQVATVGRLNVSPNTTNVIPGQVVLTVDLRDLAQATIDRFTARFEQLGREIGAATSTTFRFTQMVNSAPAISDGRLLEAIEASANGLRLTHQRMPSGAGHDAQEVAHIAPMAMIFIPSVGGISHSPKEFSRPGDITHGANVLLQSVLAADRALS